MKKGELDHAETLLKDSVRLGPQKPSQPHAARSVTAREYHGNLNFIKNEINSALPRGIEVLDIRILSYSAKDLARSLRGFIYELYLPADIDTDRLSAIKESMDKFLAAPSFNIRRLFQRQTHNQGYPAIYRKHVA